MLTPQQARATCAALESVTFADAARLGFEVNQPAGVIGDPWYAWTPRATLIGEYASQSDAEAACCAHAARFNLGKA